MKTAAAKGRRLSLLAAVCLLSTLLLVPSAEASRNLTNPLAPRLTSPATATQILHDEPSDPQPRLRLFADLSLPERPLELVEASKTASMVFALGIQYNVWQTGGLGQNRGGPSFQGLWTDPVTGIAYARNRWYDARNASWLSEDPKGAVDSSNLYAFEGRGPHAGRDPLGTDTFIFHFGEQGRPGVYTSIALMADTGDPGVNAEVLKRAREEYSSAVSEHWRDLNPKLFFVGGIAERLPAVFPLKRFGFPEGVPPDYSVIVVDAGAGRDRSGYLHAGEHQPNVHAHEYGHLLGLKDLSKGPNTIEPDVGTYGERAARSIMSNPQLPVALEDIEDVLDPSQRITEFASDDPVYQGLHEIHHVDVTI